MLNAAIGLEFCQYPKNKRHPNCTEVDDIVGLKQQASRRDVVLNNFGELQIKATISIGATIKHGELGITTLKMSSKTS